MREPYNIVEFDSSDPDRKTFIEGVAQPILDLITGRGTKVTPEEIYDDIKILDNPPEYARIGSGT